MGGYIRVLFFGGGGWHPGTPKDIPSTNPSTPGLTTQPHPKSQNNNTSNNQMKMSKKIYHKILTEHFD